MVLFGTFYQFLFPFFKVIIVASHVIFRRSRCWLGVVSTVPQSALSYLVLHMLLQSFLQFLLQFLFLVFGQVLLQDAGRRGGAHCET